MDHVETFLMVAECRNLTHAAGRLHITQSTVSRRLAALEQVLGVTLLARARGNRDVSLTEHGESFVLVAKRWQELWREAQGLRWHTPSRTLSIASVDLVNNYTLVPLYEDYLRRRDVKLWINTHHSDEIHGLVESRSVDLGFVFSEMHYRDIDSVPIYRERMFVLVHSDAPYQGRVRPEELPAECEVYLRWGTDYELWHRRHWTPDRYLIRVNTGSMLIHYLDQPGAWAIAPMSEVLAMQRHYPIRHCELDDAPPPRICYRLAHRAPKPSQQRAIDHFEQDLRRFVAETPSIEHVPIPERVAERGAGPAAIP